jgi:hypothetical protein
MDDDLDDVSDVRLINAIEKRGFTVYDDYAPDQTNEMVRSLETLYLDYMLMDKEFFDKQLRNFFNYHLNKQLL